MNEDVLLKKLQAAFASEADERIQNISKGLVNLENAKDKTKLAGILEDIFREAHSLKGAARAVNLQNIETLCQSIESVFSTLKKKKTSPGPELFDVLHQSMAFIEKLMADPEKKDPDTGLSELVKQLAEFKAGKIVEQRDQTKDRRKKPSERRKDPAEQTPPDPVKEKKSLKLPETIRLPVQKLDMLLRKAEELISVKLSLSRQYADLFEVKSRFGRWKKDLLHAEETVNSISIHQKSIHNLDSKPSQSLTKDLFGFFNQNKNHVMELEERVLELTKKTHLDYHTAGRMVDDLLEEIKSIMMLPFATICSVFPRMVRDISRQLGKQVTLEIKGEDIEVDRRILEQMKDPLIHLIRNSIDHGIELPHDRKINGKPENGTIELGVSRIEGNKIEIIISDDGRGIDVEDVRKKSVQTGILSEQEAMALSPEDTARLIFQSGISTSAIVTDLSGRGLGMAIVQENIETLGGRLFLENTPGQGTCFKIQLPVTLATFKGVLIQAGGRPFIIPNTHVIQVMKIRRDQIKTIENRETITIENRPVSFVRLSYLLGIVNHGAEDSPLNHLKTVLLGNRENMVAFEVDDIQGEQEVLVKELGPQLKRVRHILAASILADGSLVPVLNVADLLASSPAQASPASVELKKESNKGAISVLVADDSVTSRVLIKNVLEAGGYQVTTAVDGKDAYTTLKTQNFDIVVSDVEMPLMDGFELTRTIRKDPDLASVPVVLVTSLESREDREKGIDAGANAYIIKRSFDQNNLVEVVQRLV